MNKEFVEVKINLENQIKINNTLNNELDFKMQKINSLNEYKSKLLENLIEIRETNEEDPEEVKRRMLEEMKKGQSDKKMTYQEIQNRQSQVQDVMMNIN